MIDQTIQLMFQTMLSMPVSCARITGSSQIHNLVGDVYVYPFLNGSLIVADVEGIPFSGFYGFHIHQHGPCIVGEGYTGFHDVGGHFSTVENAPHPYHEGDLPPLMAFYGHAFMIVYSDRFRPEDVLGRAIIIHEWPDDFRTQPTGDSGQHIGCGTFYPCTGYLSAQPGMPGTRPAPRTPTVPGLIPGMAPGWPPGAGIPPVRTQPAESYPPPPAAPAVPTVEQPPAAPPAVPPVAPPVAQPGTGTPSLEPFTPFIPPEEQQTTPAAPPADQQETPLE